MNIPKISALYESSLSSALSASGTSFSVVSGNDRDGNALSGSYGFIIDEGTADEEFVIGTISSGTVSITYRGIDSDDPNTEITANKKAHRRGASVKITDYPVLGIMRNIMNGDEAFPNPIKYASGVGPVSADDLVDKAYADALVGGGTLSYDRIAVVGTAGETVAAGNLVYLKAADGRWWKASASTASSVENINLGIAQGAGTAGNSISGGVLIYGMDINQTGLTANVKYFAGNTAGTITNTAGTTEVTIGFSRSTTSLFFSPRYDQQITEDIQDALAGSTGVPNDSNRFITADNSTNDSTDQSQTTQNGTVEVGEANLTTKKNKLASSFIPAKTKIKGVRLYKSADSGTFTGTVKVALQADTTGSPSGSDLASYTFTKEEWLGKATGEIEVLFSSEYTSLVVGSTYWIVITTSTSDTTNHPNFGTNTAGGYASGSVKYNNTTDGWVAIATIDLYFKTLEGNTTQVVKTDSAGKIGFNFFDVAKMPVPMFQQRIDITISSPSDASETNLMNASTATTDGSTFWALTGGGPGARLQRFARNAYTGMYLMTHQVTTSISGSTSYSYGMVQLGSYLYLFNDGGVNMSCTRFLAADCSGETTMTVPTVAVSASNASSFAWTDGQFLYWMTNQSAVGCYKFSVSGTTLTTSTNGAVDSNITGGAYTQINAMCDGKDVYFIGYANVSNIQRIQVMKLGDFMATAAGATYSFGYNPFGSFNSSLFGVAWIPIDTNRAYLGRLAPLSPTSTATTSKAGIELTPVGRA